MLQNPFTKVYAAVPLRMSGGRINALKCRYNGIISYYVSTLCILGKISDDILKYFSYFSQEIGFGISCELSP